MSLKSFFFRGALSTDTKENAQTLSEYLGILVGIAVIIAIVVAILIIRFTQKANSSSW